MKLLVMGDTHGMYLHLIDSIRKIGPDKIIHLGDFVKDAYKLEEITGIETIKLRGNCDYDSDTREEILMEAEDLRIFLSHGHRYDVNSGLDRIYYRAKELEADLAIFGHIHRPLDLKQDGIRILSPGSASYPRALTDAQILEIDIDGKNAQIKSIKV